eukprot:TRINITY_DN36873_c0_g1_i1.p1 TRINITY_DN36873_c0_g1~~TRINITY_DN36873_c0_g1_i1.p1  ORF type:complete len:518 (-),score=83.99 TRINITY_DN36873_c0_g1_i1:86-1639(-)
MKGAGSGESNGCSGGKNGGSDYYKGSSVASHAKSFERQLVRERLTPDAHGVILAMVGLPARGKSFISRKVERFMQWKGLKTQMFNVGKYRRDASSAEQSGRSSFFDSSNAAARVVREAAAAAAMADSLAFLDGGGQVVIFDATNSTLERRDALRAIVSKHHNKYNMLFIEVICDDPSVVAANMANKATNSPDFANMPLQVALEDLKNRIAKYEKIYETVGDDEGPSIKLYNLSSKVMANHCYGRIAKSVVPFLMAIHIGARPIWLVRAFNGDGNPQSPVGGDRLSKLSSRGMDAASALADLVRSRAEQFWAAAGKPAEPTQVFTSTMPRAVGSVCFCNSTHEETSVLNPIDKGAIGGGWWDVEIAGSIPPWEELERRHPEVWTEWRKDPLRCRFPGGESTMDVLRRLEPLVFEVEMCTRPVLIVSHVTVLQLLVAYFSGTPIEEAWQTPVPKGTVIEVTPSLGGGFIVDELQLQAPPTLQDQVASSPSPMRSRSRSRGRNAPLCRLSQGIEEYTVCS